jgi:hypothetical protein
MLRLPLPGLPVPTEQESRLAPEPVWTRLRREQSLSLAVTRRQSVILQNLLSKLIDVPSQISSLPRCVIKITAMIVKLRNNFLLYTGKQTVYSDKGQWYSSSWGGWSIRCGRIATRSVEWIVPFLTIQPFVLVGIYQSDFKSIKILFFSFRFETQTPPICLAVL